MQSMPQTLNVGSRSVFVTVTAWVAMLTATLACASALVQYLSVSSMMPQWRAAAPSLPVLTGLLLVYLPWAMGLGATLSLALVACAAGLLLRLEWARRIFIGLLAVVILANLGGLWLQYEVVQALLNSTLRDTVLPPEVAGVFGGLALATQTMALLVTLGACAVLGWVIRRLMSDAIRQEFA
jgi:hypothetical protein